MQTIGFIGTGIMGQGMIRNLMKAGYPVQIYNRTRSKAEALEREGAVTAYEKEAPSGRKRRYYHITRTGLTLLGEKREEWRTFRHLVDAIVAEGEGSLSPA